MSIKLKPTISTGVLNKRVNTQCITRITNTSLYKTSKIYAKPRNSDRRR